MLSQLSISAAASHQTGLRRSRPGRSGTSILELVVGTVILGVFVSSAAPMVHWVQVTRRTNERHLCALQELSNQMERLAALPPSSITAEQLDTLTLFQSARQQLPNPELTAAIVPDDGLQKVTLSLAWRDETGQPVKSRRLTAWFPPPDTDSGGGDAE